MKFEEKKIGGDYYIYRGRIVNLRRDTVELPNGRFAEREVVEHPSGVCVAPLTDDGELVFVRQFRYPFGEELLELPAGKLSPGEEPVDCGRRELVEETGAAARDFLSLGRLYPSPGCYGEVIHLYLARGLQFGRQRPDEDEFLDVVRISLEKAVEMILKNELPDAKTQIAVLKTCLLLQKGLV